MRFLILGLLFTLTFSACSADRTGGRLPTEEMKQHQPVLQIQFLTRDGCKNTPVVLENLKAAIDAKKLVAVLTVVPQASLSADDPRVGYPTPTILANGKDIFGLGEPQQPFPEPS